jgi:hypothetical protein
MYVCDFVHSQYLKDGVNLQTVLARHSITHVHIFTFSVVRARSGHVGFVMEKMAVGLIFFEYLGFPCQSSFHQILHPHNQPGQVQ